MRWPTTPLTIDDLEKEPCPQSWPTTKFIHMTVPVRGAYSGNSHGWSTTCGEMTPKHAASAARSYAAYLSDSPRSGSKHSFGMDARSSRRDGTGPAAAGDGASAVPRFVVGAEMARGS